MFSLIITIISIALVAALAVATIYYGGSAFTQGTAKANASTLINAGQQVSGAATVFANSEGSSPATIDKLTEGGKYLQGKPAVPTGFGKLEIATVAGVKVARSISTLSDTEICKMVQFQSGHGDGTTIGAGNAIVAAQPYGCFKGVVADGPDADGNAATDKDVFFFKL